MMFEHTSRYASVETTTLTRPSGREVVHIRRRFVPSGQAAPLLGEVPVGQSDRLDLITARTLGDPQQFWRICDANDALNPLELTDKPGRLLRIPVPQP